MTDDRNKEVKKGLRYMQKIDFKYKNIEIQVSQERLREPKGERRIQELRNPRESHEGGNNARIMIGVKMR